MHLPTHPVWLWLILLMPFFVLLVLWVASNNLGISLKPLTPWTLAGLVLFFIAYVAVPVESSGAHKALSIVLKQCYVTCWLTSIWILSRSTIEILGAPNAKWYLPGRSAKFFIPSDLRIQVRDIGSVAPWYIETLGLRKSAGSTGAASDTARFRFSSGWYPVVFRKRDPKESGGTPMLFTRNIGKMREVLISRGVEPGPVEKDRQGTRYFDIHDPEGNVIEFVEQRGWLNSGGDL